MMKKILLTIGFMGMVCCALVAQTYTVKFTGRDQNGRRIPLSKVLVENQTKRWQEVLYYPDTVIFMGTVGIEDYDRNDSVKLFQNVPNPFAGSTDFSLQLNRDEKVQLEIYDLSGKLIAQHSRQLLAGHHLFRATLASPQTYLLSAKTYNGLMQIKMVNTGSGGSNVIEYLGEGVTGELQCVLNDGKGASHYPFSYGDWMLYTGYAEVANVPFTSTPVNKSQTQSESVPLAFTLPLPAVNTVNSSGVTAQSANLKGEVTSDNGYAITERGFDYGTAQNALDLHKIVGTGTGEFTTSVGSLQPGTQYYFRAFAMNAMGPNYGTVMNFTTMAAVPTVVTTGVTNIAATTATGNGNVTANGGATVTARGVCWSSTSQYPVISSSSHAAANSAGTGSFTVNMTNLTPSTTYYVRAYATNSVGTAYGSVVTLTTAAPVPPTVTTNTISSVTGTTATCGGNVTAQGTYNVTARGVCWSTSQNPTVADSHTTNGSGTGSFTSSITGLAPSTTYYVRAYATNSAGTAYGNQVSFMTANCPSTVSDYDGNSYLTVQIGSQCWMKENLRTTHYSDGTAIALGSSTSYDVAYRYYPNNSSSNVSTYGYLYNWPAVMHNSSSSNASPSGVQGICPTGWHVPSTDEWTQLIGYVGSQSQYQCGGSSSYIAKSLASTTGWSSSSTTCAVGNNPSINNTTGFSAVPAGSFGGYHDYYFGYDAFYWSATQYGSDIASLWMLQYNSAGVVVGSYHNNCGYSVRCLRDDPSLPTVTTTSVSAVTNTTATSGGTITSAGGTAVTACGVCWSSWPNPTVQNSSNNFTTNGNGTSSFTSFITGLTPSTTYYVRSYAINSAGTVYGNQLNFTTTAGFSCDTSAVTDYDGNSYQTVQIGSQCWMKQNLRTTHYSDGTSIALGNDTSTTTAYRYYPNNISSNVSTYGYLYNWKAVMRNSSSSSANPSGVQGICPTGWHVPSYAELTQLTTYVSNQSQYWCGGSSSQIAKALASTTGWSSSSDTCTVGNNPSTNNTTGFSAVPAGSYNGNYSRFGSLASYWSATQNSGDYDYVNYRYLSGYSADVFGNYGNKHNGYSVRCLRDAPPLPTVTTISKSAATQTMATSGGTITSDGGTAVTARGVCWSTSQNPTIANSHTTNGSGTGSFTSSITGLTASTTYYVRAYATNSAGTAYGNQESFTTEAPLQPCPNAVTVMDIDGNVYNTVQIGNQCWMAQNLCTTHYSDGISIALANDTSTVAAYRYYPHNDSSNVSIYGYLYNWKAVMHNSSSSSSNPSGVQGICPMGWHVPSNAEWTQLTNYVRSQSQYWCCDSSYYIAKALASTTGWTNSTNTCAVGNNPSTNNATGFSAVLTGKYSGTFYSNYDAAYWSATQGNSIVVYYRFIGYNSGNVFNGSGQKDLGLSVRCLRD